MELKLNETYNHIVRAILSNSLEQELPKQRLYKNFFAFSKIKKISRSLVKSKMESNS